MGRRIDKQVRFCTPELIFEELEERIVLDASLDHIAHDSLSDLNVILASSARPDLASFVEAAAGRAELVLYDQGDDLAALDAKLEDLAQTTGKKIGVLAVVEHGAPAELTVGTERIDLTNVDAHRSDFETLARNLADHAQIQFFGCSVAENVAGKALVDRIAAYTSADVFASNDTTGGKTGNWQLEYTPDTTVVPVRIFDAESLVGVGPLANPEMIADINTIGNINGVHFVEMNGKVYFNGDDGVHGRELWAYNPGTGAVTLIADIVSGATGSNPSWLWDHNGILYFSADDGANGVELWKSNGTASGTVLVSNIAPGAASSNPQMMMSFGGEVFFAADDGTHGVELWKSDGTASGTVMVLDINFGSNSSLPEYFTDVNGTLFFQAEDGVHGMELWRSNGTGAGTVMVEDILPGSSGNILFPLLNIDGTLFFTSADMIHGNEVWRSDGSAAGTVMVKDIRPGGGNSDPLEFCNVNGILFFQANDGANGMELWRSDGTDAGTVMVKDIFTGAEGSFPFSPANVNGTLYFVADDGTHGHALWKSNGITSGTVMVKDISPGQWTHWPQLTNMESELYFVADDGTHGLELWKSDGTDPGTAIAYDVNPGAGDGYPVFLTTINGSLYFSANDGTHGYQVWRYDAPPVAGDFSESVVQGDIVPVDGWNFTDLQGDAAQSITITDLPTHGTLFLDANTNDTRDTGEQVALDQVISWAEASTSALVKYEPTSGYVGADTLQYVVTDTQGAEGTVAGTASITVFDAVNDPPVNTVPGSQTTVEDTARVFSTGNGNAISISDPDAGTADVQVLLTGTNGTITLTQTTGLSFSTGDGTADATTTFSGTIDAINAALDGMRFVPSLNYNGTAATVSITTDDLGNTGTGGAQTDTDVVAITVTGVQDPPVAGPFTVSASEGTAVAVTGWNFTDPDGDAAQSITIAVLPAHGTLFLDGNTNNTVEPGETITTSTVIDWNDATTLAMVKYLPLAGYSGSGAFQYRVTDDQGTQGTVSGTASVTVALGPNDPPVNTVPGAQTVPEDSTLIFSTGNGNAISIADPDAGTADVLVQLTGTNGTITLAQTTGLNFGGGDGTSDATMTFTGTLGEINAALNGMRFIASADYNGPGGGVTILTNDLGNTGSGGAKVDIDFVLVTVSPVQDPPVPGNIALSVDEGTVAAVGGWNFTDPDGDQAASITVTVLPTHGTLFLDGDADDVIDPGENILAGDVISWDDAFTFGLVKYQSATGYAGFDSLQYRVTDTGGTLSVGTGTVSITVADPFNDPPVNDVPTVQTTIQNSPLVFRIADGNAISISDPDAGTADVQVQLSAANGTLTLAGVTGLSFVTGDGTADATMTFTGTMAAINTALDGMTFTPALNYEGSAATVTIVTDDLGNTGADGPKTDTDAVTMTVTANPDSPMAGDFTVAVNSSTPTWPAVGWIWGWNFTDAQNDAADSVRIVTLPTHGTLFLDGNGNHRLDAGETITAGQDIPWSTLRTFQGVKYIGEVNYNGLDSFTYVVIDDSGDAGTYQGTCVLGVGPNDPPVQTVPGTQSMQQGTTLTFSQDNGNGISVNDPDVGTRAVEVTVYSYQGTVSLGNTANVSILTGDGTDDWAVRFRGPVDAANTALDGLSFTPLAQYYGQAAVVIQTNDLGATGVGGYGVDMDVITVTIAKTSV